jgi:hypothetical protein
MPIITNEGYETICLEKLVVVQLDKKFYAPYGARIFIAVYTRARQWILF